MGHFSFEKIKKSLKLACFLIVMVIELDVISLIQNCNELNIFYDGEEWKDNL